MRIKAGVIGDIVGDLKKFDRKLEKAVTEGLKSAGDSLKKDLRAQTKAAGLGQRLANTWRGPPNEYVYPSGRYSKNAAVNVVSHAPHIIAAYDQGGIIQAKRGRYLAVPLPQAQRLIGIEKTKYRITPRLLEEWLGIKLIMIERPGRHPLLVARGVRLSGGGRIGDRRGGGGKIKKLSTLKATKNMGERSSLRGMVDVPMFVLIRQVSLRKRLDVEALARRWGESVPAIIDQRMGGR